MSKSINRKFKQNILVISIIITVIFFIINISLYLINNSYLINKVEEENAAFLQITTHIMNENDIAVALEYVEHYTHIHEVNIEILDQNDEMVYSSKVSHKYTTRYHIETLKGPYTIFIDNTESITVTRVETNTIYINISLVLIYAISLIVLIRLNKRNANQLHRDIKNVLDLMNSEKTSNEEFYHEEFEQIYHSTRLYLEDIDILTEQKEMNMKGLAHDIKTPLTLVYSYFERVLKGENINDQDRMIAFESSRKINELLNDLIENKTRQSYHPINLSVVIRDKLHEHKSIFLNKHINIEENITDDVMIEWDIKNLSRVIDNIISNAYYYSEENSLFKVTLTQEGKANLSFTSAPKHIDDFDTELIFKKGYQGEVSKTVNNYGKGYGLYLCKILLNSVNGTIEAKKTDNHVKFTIIL